MIIDTTETKIERQLRIDQENRDIFAPLIEAAERRDNTRPLSDYSDEDKIKWFDEHYEIAEEYAREKNEYNRKVYEAMFINAAKDILKRKKLFRIYEFQGIVVVNDWKSGEDQCKQTE